MAIRLRTVEGIRVALCAVESDPCDSDIYLDDDDHYALAAKFASDWQGQHVDWDYPELWRIMETQKKRDAQQELHRWLSHNHQGNCWDIPGSASDYDICGDHDLPRGDCDECPQCKTCIDNS